MLLLFLLLLLLQLLLLFLLRLLGRLLLARLNVLLVLRGRFLLALETLLLLDAFLRLLRTLLTGLLKLGLEIGLLLIVRLLVRGRLRGAYATLRLIQRVLLQLLLVRLFVGRALRRLGIALRLIQLMLALLVREGLLIAGVSRCALRRIGRVLCTLDGSLLVALLRTLGALFLVQRKLFLADVRLHRAHAVAGLVEAVVHKEPAIAVMLRDGIVVVVQLTALIQGVLSRIETVAWSG